VLIWTSGWCCAGLTGELWKDGSEESLSWSEQLHSESDTKIFDREQLCHAVFFYLRPFILQISRIPSSYTKSQHALLQQSIVKASWPEKDRVKLEKARHKRNMEVARSSRLRSLFLLLLAPLLAVRFEDDKEHSGS